MGTSHQMTSCPERTARRCGHTEDLVPLREAALRLREAKRLCGTGWTMACAVQRIVAPLLRLQRRDPTRRPAGLNPRAWQIGGLHTYSSRSRRTRARARRPRRHRGDFRERISLWQARSFSRQWGHGTRVARKPKRRMLTKARATMKGLLASCLLSRCTRRTVNVRTADSDRTAATSSAGLMKPTVGRLEWSARRTGLAQRPPPERCCAAPRRVVVRSC